MKRLHVGVSAIGVGALLAAGFLLLRDGDASVPPREHLAVAATASRPNVLVDAQGTVIEEFTGDCASGRYAYLCTRVKNELGEQLLARGGLTIKTAIDPRMQQAAQQAIDQFVSRDDQPIAAQVMIVPGTGEIRAMATSKAPDDVLAFQQGSTAMTYTLTAALEGGMRFDDGFPYAAGYKASSYTAFKNCKGQATGEPSFTITNARQRHSEFTTLRSGTQAAENTFFMKLTETVGLCESVQAAKRLGLERGDGMPLQEYETFPLGVNEVDPVSVANSYATLAARGRRCQPRAVTEVRDGAFVRTFAAQCQEVLEPPVADAVNRVLAEAQSANPLSLGRDVAAMEGTADAFTTAWYAGYTPDLTSAVALGHPLDPNRHKLSDITIGGLHYDGVYGLSIPGPIWKATMRAVLPLLPRTAFVKPDADRFGGCRDHCAPS
ncbi:penicillin-binding transpeptidase domain-containing protein [Nonomuraea sp. NPDC049695]|uniref:penicillin-binding transpeptidase domain-containing protein n=1 Tax=Nonomuraea sp. NPDC049695 TaxID=3154734 RepID=UPI0034303380